MKITYAVTARGQHSVKWESQTLKMRSEKKIPGSENAGIEINRDFLQPH